jgi:transcriptional regulator with XRE-family HTH domain
MDDAPYNRAVGSAMRLARKSAGLTTRQMAQGVRLAQSQISRLENGQLAWDIETIGQCCAFLRISLEDVMSLVSKSVARSGDAAA